MSRLEPGDAAPPFALQDQSGQLVRLADMLGERVLLYFYPKADTPGCTAQSCAVRDAREELAALGARVVGISPDPVRAQSRFDGKYGLGFPLLSDPDHSVANAYGVWGEKSMYGRTYEGVIRSSFLLERDGRVLGAWYNLSPKETVPRALQALGG